MSVYVLILGLWSLGFL